MIPPYLRNIFRNFKFPGTNWSRTWLNGNKNCLTSKVMEVLFKSYTKFIRSKKLYVVLFQTDYPGRYYPCDTRFYPGIIRYRGRKCGAAGDV